MQVTLSNDKFTATINLKGAELVSFKNHVTNKEYIWEGNPEFWGKHSPILFPIVGTLKDNSFIHEGIKYELPRHGFARDMDFEIMDSFKNKILLSLKYDDETLKMYPFKFKLLIYFNLSDKSLYIFSEVVSYDEVDIPFNFGLHPAFALKEKFENYSLQFEKQETLKCFTLEDNLLSDKNYFLPLENKKLPLTYSLFKNDALIFKTLESKEITILENNKKFIKLSFFKFQNLGIWTKQNAPFICIEPWAGYSDSIHSNQNLYEKDGIQILAPKQSKNYQFIIEIL